MMYLHDGRLWAYEVGADRRRRLTDDRVDTYAADARCRVAAYVRNGRLYRLQVDDGTCTALTTAGPVRHPRPDPTGQRIAYLTDGTLRVTDGIQDELLAGEPGVLWGTPDPASRSALGRRHGYWWSPLGDRVLATRVVEDGAGLPSTSLHLLELDGFWVDVRWDRQAYPHVAAVTWQSDAGPLVTVMPRDQHHALVLVVDARTGETQVHAEMDDPRWVSVTPGTPSYLPDGRVVLGGELTLDGWDTQCLFADGTLLTPPSLYVHRLCGLLPGAHDHAVDLIVEASDAEPSERHVYRIRVTARHGNPEVARLTDTGGWHTGHVAGQTLVVASESLDHAGTRMTVHAPDGHRTTFSCGPAGDSSGPAPRPVMSRVTDRRLPCAVLYPSDHVTGRRLPVLIEVAGAPGRQGVVAARRRWRERQWYADAGFAVVVIDSRGSHGVSPGFEKAIYRRLADIMLTDQVDGLSVLATKHPDLDTGRVAITGTGLGGFLAIAGVLWFPEVYAAAVATDPITDWSLEPPGYAERFLGAAEDNPEAYLRHDLVTQAAELTRPLMLISSGPTHPRAVHLRRMADALRAAGRRYEVCSRQEATPRRVVEFLRTALLDDS